jgi:hypothetical protein
MAVDLGPFDPLTFYRYRVDLRLDRPLAVAAGQRAVLWRGAFGAVFRGLVCHDLSLECDQCPLRASCPFPRVFAPSIPPGRPEIHRLQDPPRPFVLADPHPAAPALPAGQSLPLGLTLVGTTVTELPYFVVSLRRLGEAGIGRDRARFQVESVRCVDRADMAGAAVFEQGSDLVRPLRVSLRARDLMRPGDAGASRVRVRFVTPTEVRGGPSNAAEDPGPTTEPALRRSSPVTAEAPSFGTLLRRARGRAGALATFFGEGPIEHDAAGLGALADSVSLVAAEVTWAQVLRRSSRTGQKHAIGGVVGSVVYEGQAVGELMPWLRLAEALGVGKHATFGNGRIAIDVLE